MTQYYFDEHFPNAKIVKTGSISIGEIENNITGVYQLTDTGHIKLTWREPCQIYRYCDIDCRLYYQLLHT